MFGLNHAQEAFIIIVLSLGTLYAYWYIRNANKKKRADSNHWKQKKLNKKTKS